MGKTYTRLHNEAPGLTRHGVFIGEYMTPDELGKVVDFAERVEDDPGQPATGPKKTEG